MDPAEFRSTANEWSYRADELYRASVILRDLEEGSLRVGVKDLIDVRGLPTRLGLPRYRRYPQRSAAALAGVPSEAVTAKLISTELGIGMRHGCVNPYFPHLDPAGSSTGSAVAVAAGICDLALGTDTVVSVRLPAAACGIVGLRLTHRPAAMSGTFVLSSTLDAPGWMTRTVDDLAYLWHRFELTLGNRGHFAAPPARLRVGVLTEVADDEVEPEMRAAFDAACAALVAAGHDVVPVSVGELFRNRGLAYELCARDAWDSYRRHRDQLADSLDDSTVEALQVGAAVSDARQQELLATQTAYRDAALRSFAEHRLDAWLMPAGTLMPRNLFVEEGPSSTIPQAGERRTATRVNYATMASFAGLPAITFPIGFSPDHHAPIGVQAMAPPHAEPTLIALASAISDAAPAYDFSLAQTRHPSWPADLEARTP
ncbi:amidase [Micromonospora sp. DT233]|uniref:amidase n=1 Tax=Micromonospora sp. DT233 TaxID=3393432 RepID=UPI003CF6AE3B